MRAPAGVSYPSSATIPSLDVGNCIAELSALLPERNDHLPQLGIDCSDFGRRTAFRLRV